MKGVTVRQPFANAIKDGIKNIEVRHQRTHYRGLVAIHAAQNVHDLATREGYNKLNTHPRGCIIAVGRLVDVIEYQTIDQFIKDRLRHCVPPDYYRHGKTYGWVIEGVEKLNEPIDYKGKLGVYELNLHGGLVLGDR